MLKKFVSKALLSVVMDKKARNTLEAVRERQSSAARNPGQGEAVMSKQDNKPVQARQALERAEKDLNERPQKMADRQALIQQALAVRQDKAQLLDDLPPAQREQLQSMAMKAFAIDGKKGGG